MSKSPPFDFLLDYLPANTVVKPAIGMFYLYLEGKIIFIFRNTKKNPQYNGIWIAADRSVQTSLKTALPAITDFVFEDGEVYEPGWLLLNDNQEDFEATAINLCELVTQRDTRIGRATPKALALTTGR